MTRENCRRYWGSLLRMIQFTLRPAIIAVDCELLVFTAKRTIR